MGERSRIDNYYTSLDTSGINNVSDAFNGIEKIKMPMQFYKNIECIKIILEFLFRKSSFS